MSSPLCKGLSSFVPTISSCHINNPVSDFIPHSFLSDDAGPQNSCTCPLAGAFTHARRRPAHSQRDHCAHTRGRRRGGMGPHCSDTRTGTDRGTHMPVCRLVHTDAHRRAQSVHRLTHAHTYLHARVCTQPGTPTEQMQSPPAIVGNPVAHHHKPEPQVLECGRHRLLGSLGLREHPPPPAPRARAALKRALAETPVPGGVGLGAREV